MTQEEKKEATIKGWVVREVVIGHYLTFFRYKPKRNGNGWVDCHNDRGARLADYKHKMLEEIKEEDGPVKVELTIKVL